MFILYPIILFIHALLLIYRNEYYRNYSIDPLFICKFCPTYQKYSSPNAPQLSSILDPNNVHLFNNVSNIHQMLHQINKFQCLSLKEQLKMKILIIMELLIKLNFQMGIMI